MRHLQKVSLLVSLLVLFSVSNWVGMKHVQAATLVNVCGTVTAYTAPTASLAGSVTIGGVIYPILAGVNLTGAALLTPGANVCLSLMLDGLNQVTSGSVTANVAATVNVCGIVTAYTPATATVAGSITIGGVVYPIAAGTTITNANLITLGTNLCFGLTVNGLGQITLPSSVVVGATANVSVCGLVTAYVPATATTAGSITVGGITLPIAIGATINGQASIAVGVNLQLTASLNIAGQVTSQSSVTVQSCGTGGVCGIVTAYVPATGTTAGSITVGGVTLTLLPGTVLGSVTIGAQFCLNVPIVCGTVTAYVPATTTTAGLITINGTTIPLAAGTTLGAQVTIGSNFCLNPTVPPGGPQQPFNIGVSDQKAGSLLVFPYYTSDATGAADTRITISHLGNAVGGAATSSSPNAGANAVLHLFFLDRNTCTQADTFVSITPNGSFSFNTSEFDPLITGYLIAVAVDPNTGCPIRQNILAGNAFVKAPAGTISGAGAITGNYGAESFWAFGGSNVTPPFTGVTGLSQCDLSVATPVATLNFDGVSGYDNIPSAFATEIRNPLDAPGQTIVVAGLAGNIAALTSSGGAQVGVGALYSADEKLGSFSSLVAGGCLALGTIRGDNTSPRVPQGINTLIPRNSWGTVKFNVTAGVGLLITPANVAGFQGIRTLHKTQLNVQRFFTIPVFTPSL